MIDIINDRWYINEEITRVERNKIYILCGFLGFKFSYNFMESLCNDWKGSTIFKMTSQYLGIAPFKTNWHSELPLTYSSIIYLLEDKIKSSL